MRINELHKFYELNEVNKPNILEIIPRTADACSGANGAGAGAGEPITGPPKVQVSFLSACVGAGYRILRKGVGAGAGYQNFQSASSGTYYQVPVPVPITGTLKGI